ncbi:MAG: hypothetical protein K1000chlam1_01455, partial [Candidatus Anoxychlamydiales bacterium]|nr:hypothetical protein [Candidatus Anoxychlamydiales bacterium]
MVDPVNTNTANLTQQSWVSKIREKVPFIPAAVKQSDLISEIQSARHPLDNKNLGLEEKTNTEANKFIKHSTLYIKVNFFHSYCNAGDKTADADKLYRLAVKDLSRYNNPGIIRIRRVMKKYFPHLSLFRMLFFNLLFISWRPQKYIQKSIDKTLSFSRFELHQGDYLPDLGSKLISEANTFLANYNRSIERFRDDPNNTLGDRDEYVQKELRKPEILGYKSIDKFYKKFANAASRDDIRVRFAPLSSRIKKLQLLDYKLLKNYANIVRVALMPITITLGIVPLILAKVLEFIPDRIAKKGHSYLIASFMPSMLDNTLEAVARPGFTHAINSFLCDVLEDLLKEMDKAPKDRELKDIPNVVNEALSEDIKQFSEHLFTLLTREPYKSQDELKHITKYGLEPSSPLERFFKFFTSKHYVDRAWTKDIFVNKALHPSIIEGFNFLFAQPEKLEEYLCNLMEMLNKIYDHVPDANTEEGRALLDEQIEKQKRREKLVDKAIEKGINLATDNIFNIGSGAEKILSLLPFNIINIGSLGLTKSEQVDLIDSYKKIKQRATKLLPDIASDAKDILNSSGHLDPTSSQAKQAKEDIDTAIKDIERLFVAVSNVMPDENSATKRVINRKLRGFLNKEYSLKESILNINDLHEQLNGLKEIEVELIKFNKTLSRLPSNIEKQMAVTKKHIDRLEEINFKNQFNPIIKTYIELAD